MKHFVVKQINCVLLISENCVTWEKVHLTSWSKQLCVNFSLTIDKYMSQNKVVIVKNQYVRCLWLNDSVWIRNQLDVTFMLSFISPSQFAQHVSGNHVPIFRSWRLRSVIAMCWCSITMSGIIQICLSVWVDMFYVCLVYGKASVSGLYPFTLALP